MEHDRAVNPIRSTPRPRRRVDAPVAELPTNAQIDIAGEALADRVAELSEMAAQARSYLTKGDIAMTCSAAADLQFLCWQMNFTPKPVDLICDLARVIYEQTRGMIFLRTNFRNALL